MTIRCDLHVHTHHSFDCFCTMKDIVKEAKRKEINVIAITDHDVIGLTPKEKKFLNDNGIYYIQGCEFTTDKGAHLIGLFIDKTILNIGKNPVSIVNNICQAGGIVLVPHPFRKNSGFIEIYANDTNILNYVLSKATLIELQSGKSRQKNSYENIRQIAEEHKLKLITASDSHRPWELGCCFIQYNQNIEDITNLRHIFNFLPLELKTNAPKETNKNSNVLYTLIKQRSKFDIYNNINKSIPFPLKRNVKKIIYLLEKYCRIITGQWKTS